MAATRKGVGINIAPPHKTLPIKVESGDPTVVRFEHEGQKYTARVTHTVLAVWPAGGVGPNDIPNFNIQVAPVMVVTREEGEG